LNWCLEGWKDYQENGLYLPDVVASNKEGWKAECDDYNTFMDTFFDRDTEGSISRNELYHLFKLWWHQVKPSAPTPNAQKFTQECRRLGLVEKKIQGDRQWAGIKGNADFLRYQADPLTVG